MRISDHRIVEGFLEWDAARHHCCILTFGKKPFRFGPHADFPEQRREHYTCPLALTRQPAQFLRPRLLASLAAKIARAFQETDAADRRKAFEIAERKNRGPLDQTVNEQAVRAWIDCGNAGMMPLEVQIRWRYRAVEVLERRSRNKASRRPLRLLKR